MKRIDNILKNSKFLEYISKTAFYEQRRPYCLHNINHALDVARIAYIRALEAASPQEAPPLDKEIIYAAALIHDVGRCVQYENGAPHEAASVALGGDILRDCGFNDAEINVILTAVGEHRAVSARSPLGELLAWADDMSRMCMICAARDTCKWKAEDMNMEVQY